MSPPVIQQNQWRAVHFTPGPSVRSYTVTLSYRCPLGARTVDSEGLRADFRPWQHMMAEYDWIKART